MILLDTNILSETLRPSPDATVMAWLKAQPTTTLATCAPALAEIRFGIEILAIGRKRSLLGSGLDSLIANALQDRIFPFDASAVPFYAAFRARRRNLGRPASEIDMMIAAIAASRHATVATRNVGDFDDLDIQLVNPFAKR